MPERQSRTQPAHALLARVWPSDRTSLALLFVATGNFLVLSALLVYPDPVLDDPLMIGPERDRREVGAIVVSTRLIRDMPWSVIGADLIEPDLHVRDQPPK